MNAVYQQRRNLELALDRFNWAKPSDHVSPSSNAGLNQRKAKSKPSAQVDHTDLTFAQNTLNAPRHPRKQQHQLELVHQRKRLKQAGTGTGGPSKAATTTNIYANRNPNKKGGSSRNTGGGAGPSKPRKEDAAGGGGDDGENNNNDDADDHHDFDLTDEELPKTVDTQCAQCDDGGFLIECIGRCRRAFHVGIEPEEEAGGVEELENLENDDEVDGEKGNESYAQIECNVINMAEDLAIALATSSSQLLCPSCLAYEQRCSLCGKFDDEGTKVRPCLVASCGHFYHPACMKEAKRHMNLNNAARSLKEMCPLHWCCVCGKQGDDGGNEGENNELVQCRRCPTAYHRGCIPPSWNGFEEEPQRAWMADFDPDGHLLPGCTVETSMLYCQEHELDDEGTARHKVPLFTEDMKKAWALHYAKEFPHLNSSKKLLKEKGVLGLVRESPAVVGGALGMAGGAAGGATRSIRHALGGNTVEGVPSPTAVVIPESIRALDATSMRATTERDAIMDAGKMLDEEKRKIDIASVKSGMVQPYPYRNKSKSSIDRVRYFLNYFL